MIDNLVKGSCQLAENKEDSYHGKSICHFGIPLICTQSVQSIRVFSAPLNANKHVAVTLSKGISISPQFFTCQRAEKSGRDHLMKGQLKYSCIITSRILSNLILNNISQPGVFLVSSVFGIRRVCFNFQLHCKSIICFPIWSGYRKLFTAFIATRSLFQICPLSSSPISHICAHNYS